MLLLSAVLMFLFRSREIGALDVEKIVVISGEKNNLVDPFQSSRGSSITGNDSEQRIGSGFSVSSGSR